MTKKIITIEPAKTIRSSELPSLKKRKVAGYARVSTDHDDQTTSYEAQMNYYTEYISSRSDWEFVKMYSDEGISGTNTKKRLGFQEMVEDALDGKIDLILTKSVSRFARNTVDSLTTVRKLKEVGVEIYFEKENIWTLDSKGELLITIMSSLAQEESRSISENVKWSKRKLAAEGAVSFGYGNVLGFKVGENGGFEIDEDEAKIVRYIFGLFLQGENPNSIAKLLTQKGIPTPAGKTVWSYATVKRMLQNEKYKGDALLQKSFTVDYLTKQKKKNEGELPQYYVENNHQAIIDKATFDLVQLELQKTHNRNKVSFCGKIICGCCGNSYGRHVWHSNSEYRQYVYRCNQKYKGKKKCDTPSLKEEHIHRWSIQAINQVITNKTEIIQNMEMLVTMLENTDELTEIIKDLELEMADIQEQAEKMVERNTKVIQNQEIYQAEYDELVSRYDKLQSRLLEKQSTLQLKRKRSADVRLFVDLLDKQEHMVTAFDEKLFNTLVDKMVIYTKEKVEVHFKNGQVIEI
ncbi:site-specific DNA recombinase [Streptococcus gallinaceus]|uniref:recombinase family protein n=1 Tax=Streptococcus gallinaceus TaxID=165758 RepID=UPI0020A20C8A|nr:recombinase family protein [Streptococcus gallinaceus]MCP1638624.1 site-specific DNA recombinase [Streptococcus gallinaceus]MCP1769289.1 site-specific DNA recombinase [Streptococcus gallinaceus]